jgi:hypothetical protein
MYVAFDLKNRIFDDLNTIQYNCCTAVYDNEVDQPTT